MSISGTAGLLTIGYYSIIASGGTGTVNVSAGGRYNFGNLSVGVCGDGYRHRHH